MAAPTTTKVKLVQKKIFICNSFLDFENAKVEGCNKKENSYHDPCKGEAKRIGRRLIGRENIITRFCYFLVFRIHKCDLATSFNFSITCWLSIVNYPIHSSSELEWGLHL